MKIWKFFGLNPSPNGERYKMNRKKTNLGGILSTFFVKRLFSQTDLKKVIKNRDFFEKIELKKKFFFAIFDRNHLRGLC